MQRIYRTRLLRHSQQDIRPETNEHQALTTKKRFRDPVATHHL